MEVMTCYAIMHNIIAKDVRDGIHNVDFRNQGEQAHLMQQEVYQVNFIFLGSIRNFEIVKCIDNVSIIFLSMSQCIIETNRITCPLFSQLCPLDNIYVLTIYF